MRKNIIAVGKKFTKEKKWAKSLLDDLDKVFKLKNAYVEIYLTEGDFNVHSFPGLKDFPRPDLRRRRDLGEIYLCPNYIRKEAKVGKWGGGSYKELFFRLLIHGFLHLLGYDHKKKGDKIKMNKKEQELCKLLV